MANPSEKDDIVVLTTGDLRDLLESRFEDKQKGGWNAPGVAKDVLHLLTRIANSPSSRVIDVSLEMPKTVAKGLRTGEFVRMGGVVRESGNARIVKHLNEIRPSVGGQTCDSGSS